MFKKAKWRKAVKKAKTERKKLRDQLDKLWAILVKLQVGGKCERCGSTEHLNSHHIFSRSNLSVRWDLDNGVCLCVGHHTFGRWSAHKAPIWFIEWIKEKRGIEWYERLRVKANEVKKWTIPELKELLEGFKKEIKSE